MIEITVKDSDFYLRGRRITYSEMFALTGSLRLNRLLEDKKNKYTEYTVTIARAFAEHGIPKLLIHPNSYKEDEQYKRIDTGVIWECRAVNNQGEVILSEVNDAKEIMCLEQFKELNKWTLLY